jgi:polar amino acid transport system permease protein
VQFLTPVLANWGPLLTGASMTLIVSALAIGIGMLGGLGLCFVAISKNALLRGVANIYTSFFRGTPLLVQLLLAFYLLPPLLGIDIPSMVAAIGALAMNTTAFQAEIYRGGIAAIPPGQIEAARVLGLSAWQTGWRVLIPQMIRLVLPPLTNEAISIVKASSLVSVVGVTELMRVSEQVVAVTFRPIEMYLAAAAIYFAMTYLLAAAGRLLERRFGRYV